MAAERPAPGDADADADADAREDRIAEVLGELHAAREAGELVDLDAVDREHPDIAAEVRRCFDLASLLGTERARAADMPRQIGPYRIGHLLGTGGMGSVYAAEGSRGQVALKIVHPHLIQTKGFVQRFLREAQIGGAVAHPNVVRTLDFAVAEAAGRPYHFIVMEYVEGMSLREFLEEVDTVPDALCRHVGLSIARGLSAIHATGAVHRDVKPENILIGRDKTVKVMDLGVARLTREAQRLSRSGSFAGSLNYAAPEQFDKGGDDIDDRADLHALGIVLYELASGHHPFIDDDLREVIRRIVSEVPPKLREIDPDISPFLESVVARLVAKNPDDRYSSAAALARTLEDAGEGGGDARN